MRFTPSNRSAPANSFPGIDSPSQPDTRDLTIPRLLHQIWLGGKPPPPRWAAFSKRLRAMHPGWKYRLWTEASSAALLSDDETGAGRHFARWENFGFRSDLLRLLILYRCGGIYLDTDCEPLRPLGPLLAGRTAFVGNTFQPQPIREVFIENAVMAFAPAHPFVRAALARIADSCAGISDTEFSEGRPDVLFLTGPAFLSGLLRDYRQTTESFPRDVSLLPGTAFYPVTPGGPGREKKSGPSDPAFYPETYVIHWWDGSWVRQQDAQRRGEF